MRSRLDHDLRERWQDPAAGEIALREARVELQTRQHHDAGDAISRSHVGRALQRLSEACRLSGLLEESLLHKDAAIEIWEVQGKRRASFLVRLQRALVVAEMDASAAEEPMTRLGREVQEDPELCPYYLDFWLEYEGRRLYWCGHRDHAVEVTQRALEFRNQFRAASISRWTEHALELLRATRETL